MRTIGFLLASLALLAAAPAGSHAEEMTWTMKSTYRYRVQLEFYSQDRSHAWPGGDQAYSLDDDDAHIYTLRCNRGEKICYGAWVKGDAAQYWGVGLNDRHDCTNCCGICGEDNPRKELKD